MSAWQTASLPADFARAWRAQGMGEPPQAKQHRSGLTALVGRELWPGEAEPRWHISLRYGNPGRDGRVPSWDELVEAVHALRPGVPFVVGIPPRSWWMSVHPDVLHCWQTRDNALIEEWKRNRSIGQGRGTE
jgi:hypothetical protein